jgi:hypothetical protein
MKNTLSTPFIVAVAACFGAIALPIGLRAPATHAGDASEQPKLPPAAADEISGGAWQTLLEAARTYLPDDPPGSNSAEVSLQTLRKYVRAVVVTVPDPKASQLSIYFDEAVDALTSSAADAHYVADRSWLPWRPAGQKSSKAKRCSQPCAAKPEPDPAREPGVLVFRDDSTPARLLAVLLVGESEAFGMQREAMQQALRWASELAPAAPVQVLGPFFSGSAPALARALQAHSAARRVSLAESAVVTTGSATGDLSALQPAVRRAVVPDHELIAFLSTKLCARERRVKLALITETGTMYGADTALAGSQRDATACLRAATEGMSVYHFPLHIARVRAAHDQQAPDLKQANDLRQTLALHFESDDDSASVTPSFSSLSKFDAELSLRNTLRSIARDGPQYLLIAATDPDDLVFIAREAHSYCPGIQLVALGAQALLAHPDLSAELSGLLVASSYPLIPENQAWEAASRWAEHKSAPIDHRTFASDPAEGVYNALQWILSDIDARSGAARAGHFIDWRAPNGGFGPRAWLTVIDSSRAWPVAIGKAPDWSGSLPSWRGGTAQRSPSGALQASFRRAGLRGGVRPTAFASGFAALLLCLSLIHLGMFGVIAGYAPARDWDIPHLRLLAPPPEEQRLAHHQYVAACAFTMVVFDSLVALATRDAYRAAPLVAAEAKLVGAALDVAVLAIGLLSCIGCYHLGRALLGLFAGLARTRPLKPTAAGEAPPPAAQPRVWARRYPLLVGVAIAALTLALLSLGACATYGLWRGQDAADTLLALIRLGDPLGMCPLSALFFVGFGLTVWALMGLVRISCAAAFPWTPPFTGESDLSAARLSEAFTSLAKPWRERLIAFELATVFAFSGPFIYFASHLRPTFEWPGFDALFKATFLTLYAAVVLAFVHFSALSRLLHRLLTQLASLPMNEAYDRISVRVAAFGLQLSARVPDPRELELSARSCELLAAMAKNMNGAPGSPEARIAAAAGELSLRAQQIVGALKRDGLARRDYACTVHRVFFETAGSLSAVLQDVWKLRVAAPQLEPVLKTAALDQLLPGGQLANLPTALVLNAAVSPECYLWVRTAEDFVAMRTATFVHHALQQIRLLLSFALLGSLAVLSAAFAYPFQPHRFMSVFSGALLLVIAAAALRVIMRLERDEVLSRLAQTKPGSVEFTPQFMQQVVLYVVLPLAALTARVFPELSDTLFSWLAPLRSVLQ